MNSKEFAEPTAKGHCVNCAAPIYQHEDGRGAYEVGLQKWFSSIEPWPTIVLLCKPCFRKLISNLDLTSWQKLEIEKQEARRKELPNEKAVSKDSANDFLNKAFFG